MLHMEASPALLHPHPHPHPNRCPNRCSTWRPHLPHSILTLTLTLQPAACTPTDAPHLHILLASTQPQTLSYGPRAFSTDSLPSDISLSSLALSLLVWRETSTWTPRTSAMSLAHDPVLALDVSKLCARGTTSFSALTCSTDGISDLKPSSPEVGSAA